MIKRITFIIALLCALAHAQTTTTNLNLALPAYGSANWNAPINSNSQIIDNIFSVGTCGDGQHALSYNSTTKTFGCQLLTSVVTGGTCTNQAVTAINTSGVPTCITLTSAYVNTSIALTGTDINTSNQVTSTHITGGTVSTPAEFNATGNLVNSTAAHIVSLFSTCSGTQYLGADGACHNASAGGVTSVATTSPITGGPITTTGTIACATCVTSTSPGVGIAHFAGATQAVTSSLIVAADITAATITGTQIASSVALAGSPTTTTQSAADNSTKIATTAYVDAAAGGGAGQYLDPTKYVFMEDDFVQANSQAGTNGSAIASAGMGVNWILRFTASGQATFTFPSDSGTYGILALQAGNTSTQGTRIESGNSAVAPYNATTFDMKWRIKLGATTNIQVAFGLSDDSGYGEATGTNFMGIGFTTATDSQWMAVGLASGVATRTAIAGTVDTNYHTLRIRSAVAGTMLCSVDGGAETSVSTHIPTAAMNPQASILTLTSAAKTTTIDYFWHWYAITR